MKEEGKGGAEEWMERETEGERYREGRRQTGKQLLKVMKMKEL